MVRLKFGSLILQFIVTFCFSVSLCSSLPPTSSVKDDDDDGGGDDDD